MATMQYGYHKEIDPRKLLVYWVKFFRRVSSSVMWARGLIWGMGLHAPARKLRYWLGLLVRENLSYCVMYLVWGLCSTDCHNRMPHNRGTPPLAWLRPCGSRGPPKPVSTAPGTKKTPEYGHDGPHLSICSRPRHTGFWAWDLGSAALLKILILPFASSVTLGNLLNSGPQFSHH